MASVETHDRQDKFFEEIWPATAPVDFHLDLGFWKGKSTYNSRHEVPPTSNAFRFASAATNASHSTRLLPTSTKYKNTVLSVPLQTTYEIRCVSASMQRGTYSVNKKTNG